MINEDFVSYETARLLKEKGFDVEGVSEFGGYYVDHKHNGQNVGIATESMMLNKTLEDWEYLRPTLQMAMKWLRKVHKIFIRPNIIFLYPIRYYCEIFCYGDNLKTQQDVTTENFESPEEACEAAIKYCLENLIVSNTNSGTATTKAEG